MDALVNIADVCTEIFAGGDAPKGKISKVKTDEYSVPIFSNGEADCGLYGYTNFSRVNQPSVTVSARGTIGFTAIRNTPFVPIVRLITLTPDLTKIDIKYLYYALQNYKFDGSGTSIPQLTVPMLKNYSFPLPIKSKQLSIVEKLDELSELASLRKQQLAKLDELVKSRFIELFIGKG
jgi:type I restriction enzyme S subunit